MKDKFRKICAVSAALLLSAYSDLAFATETEATRESEHIARLATTDDIWRVVIAAAMVIAVIGVINIIRMLIEHKNKK